jgi:hypothetical protein
MYEMARRNSMLRITEAKAVEDEEVIVDQRWSLTSWRSCGEKTTLGFCCFKNFPSLAWLVLLGL